MRGRRLPLWALLVGTGAIAVASGALPLPAAREVAIGRGGPIMVFLVAITVLAELADRAGVFDVAAVRCARAAGGSTWRLFGLVAVLGTVTTIGMSLDTTAVLLTPVVLALTARLGLSPMPFALLAVWLANTASLLLPVSNLTNLLAVSRLSLSTPGFAARMALPELAAVLVTVGYLAVLYRRQLAGRYAVPEPYRPANRVRFAVCAGACAVLAWCPHVRQVRPWRAIRSGLALVPWRLVLLTEGLFLTVTALTRHGGTRLVMAATGHSPAATTAVAALTSNAANNLPAYLAVESAVAPGHRTQLLAALLGTNAGPLVLVWGSLATLLWRERCRARGVTVPATRFALVGLGGVPLVLLASWGALQLTS